MIITIRNQIKQSTFRYIAFFIVVVLGVGMISIPSLLRQQGIGESWAIKVNGTQVSYQSFAREIAEQSEFLAQVRAQYGQYADLLFQAMGWPTDPRALAVEELIKTTLMNQFVRDLGINVHSEYISESINDAQFARRHLQRIVPPFVFDQTGSLDLEKLKMFLQHKGISIKEFENKVEQSLAQLQAIQFVGLSCYVPSFDIEQEFIINKLGKQFSYLTFSLDSFLAAEKRSSISDEDARAFYDKENIQRRRYWVPEKRDGTVWKFNPHSYNVSISEEQISHYYEDNKVSKYVLDPIKVEVRQISEKQLSQYPDLTLEMVKDELINNPSCPWSKKWESLKPFARGEHKGEFERETFLLQNEGDISSVIDTKDGKVIVQLVRRIARTYKPLSAVRSEIKSILAEKQFKKSFVKDLRVIITQDDVQAIESAIAQKTGKKEMALGIIKNDTRLSQELFGLKKNEYGVFIEGDTGFVALLTNIAERNLPAFDSIKEVVKDDLYEERAYNAMISAVEEAKKAATQSSFEQIAKEFNATLHRTGMVQSTDSKKMQELDKKNLPTKTMLGLDKVGALMVHNDDRVSFLIKLDAIEDYSQEDLIAAQAEIKPQVIANRMKMQVESVVASLHRNATIETNESTQIAGEEYSE
jgi:hypothetical protein